MPARSKNHLQHECLNQNSPSTITTEDSEHRVCQVEGKGRGSGSRMDTICTQYRLGLLDRETLYPICGSTIAAVWVKFKPVIDEYKKRGEFSADSYKNWEILANEMAGVMQNVQKEWTFTPDTMKREDFDYAYKK